MSHPHFVLLYVNEPEVSAAFYARLLDRQPLDSSPNFVMFELSPDLRLGLWARRDVQPAPSGAADAGELAMAVGTKEEVEALYAPIRSAKAQRSYRSPLPWTLAGLSSPRTRTDTGFGCSVLRLRRRPQERENLRRSSRFEPISRAALPNR